MAANPGAVIFLGGTNPNTGSYNWGNVPQKLVTFTNTSNNHETIYPFLYSPNNNQIYDPIDTANDEYRLYIGYQNNGKFILGLPYGKTITIDVPLVFWNGGRADIATDGDDLLPHPNQVQTLTLTNSLTQPAHTSLSRVLPAVPTMESSCTIKRILLVHPLIPARPHQVSSPNGQFEIKPS